MKLWKSKVTLHGDVTESDKKKILEAQAAMDRAVCSQEFKDRVIGHSYKTTVRIKTGFLRYKTEARWIKGYLDCPLTGLQVYERIIQANEKLRPEIDGEADIDLTLYTKNNSTVGYTYPNTLMQWANKKFWSAFTIFDIAGNLFHEWLHKMGFGHSSNYTSLRKYSVPYALGYLVIELGEKYNKQPSTWKLADTFSETKRIGGGSDVH